MSVLGEFIRADAEALDAVRHDPAPFQRIWELDRPARLDIDKFWEQLTLLLDEAGCPLNPISGGSPFPDASSIWATDYGARSLSIDQVQQTAAYFDGMPYETIAVHVPAVAVALGSIGPYGPDRLRPIQEDLDRLDHMPNKEKYLELLPFEAVFAEEKRSIVAAGGIFGELADTTVASMHRNLAALYTDMAKFFDAAAEAGQCTVFWRE